MIEEGPFTELIGGLRMRGRDADAEALESLKVVGWTSSRQMVRQLGQAVRELDLPDDLREVVQRCMREVRKAG
jgi:hypothetical protein